ncbi:MAG: c-type cytochrome [Betaproteobacteria bacterium]|nr:c-type cytochrome [Betaproteobacteria bacterium]
MNVRTRLKRRALGIVAAAGLGLAFAAGALAADRPSKAKPPETPQLLEKGSVVYFQRCSFCHGLLGDGEGPAAAFLDPRPRDFTLGTYKFRTTQSGKLPTDEDLFRTVSRGLPGTAMQAFDNELIKNGLSEEERWAVIAYIKTFAREFNDPQFDPYKQTVALPQNLPAMSEATIAKGKEVFEHAKCWECHGKQGRGDGQKAFDRTDDWGFPIRIRNVTHPWKIKGGDTVEDIYMRFSTGINGTPMPSFVEGVKSAEDRWALATYIKSLQHKLTEHQVLRPLRIEGEVPLIPEDPAWAKAPPMDVRLAGQVVVPPRWQNPSVDFATVRAVANDKEISFLVHWDDPFKDVVHKDDQEFNPKDIAKVGAYNSYVDPYKMVPRKLETFRDAVALQFPVKRPEGTKKPHFLRGDASNPVHLWVWKADLEEQGKRSVEEAIARGWKQPAKAQAETQQQVSGKALWKEGRWSVVMKRPLITEDRSDIQFVPGVFIPMSLNLWDGSNGEHGLAMAISTWHYVFLEAPTPVRVYGYSAFAVLATGLVGFGLMKKVQKESKT